MNRFLIAHLLYLDPLSAGLLALQVKAKVLSRHKHVRVILSHAGGYVPYQATRIAQLAGDKEQDIHKFYFDTALSGARSLTV